MKRPLLGAGLGPSFLQQAGESELCPPPLQHYSGEAPSQPLHPLQGCSLGSSSEPVTPRHSQLRSSPRLLLGLFLGGLLHGVPDDSRRLGCPLPSDIVGINVRRRTSRNMASYQCQTLR